MRAPLTRVPLARDPPAETFYFPIETGPYRMAMGLTTVPISEWFEIDALYTVEIAERRRLLAADRHAMFGVTPGAEAACAETLASVMAHLTAHYPDWFQCDNGVLRYHLTGEVWDIAAHDPLELAGRLVQEDLCVIEASPEGPRLSAAVLCFPSRWRLHEKLGRPLALVHEAVPFYAERLARPVDRFMARVGTGAVSARLNWSVLDDAALFQPSGKWREAHDPSVTPENAGERLFLRVERQTLRRLPVTGAILFGIRVHVYPMTRVAETGGAAVLAAAIRALPAATAHYKSLPAFQAALLDWLDRQGGAAPGWPTASFPTKSGPTTV